jgi:hypothetical protein
MDDESPLHAEVRERESALLALLAEAEAGHGRLLAEETERLRMASRANAGEGPERAPREEPASDGQRERAARAAERERVRKADAAEREAANRLRLGEAERRLRELKRHAKEILGLDARAASVGAAAPTWVDIAGLENALDEAERIGLEIERRRALRDALEEAIADYTAAIADLAERAERNEPPASLDASLKSLERAEAACVSAAREAAVSPDSVPRMREASGRARAVVAVADRLVGKFRASRKMRTRVLVALAVVALAALGHFALLSRSTVEVRVALPDGMPEGGAVAAFLDGKPLSRSDIPSNGPTVWRVPELGQAELRIVAPGYDDFARSVSVRYGRNRAGEAELVRSKGALSVTSDLPGAEVRVEVKDTAVTGVAPCSFDLPTGEYEIVVAKGLLQATRRASVEKGRNAAVHVPVPRAGLELAALPAKSRFTLSRGEGAPIASGELPASLAELPAGDYRIDFRFGEITASREVSVAAGETGKIVAVLPLGDLRIESSGTREPPSYRLIRAGSEESSGKTPAVLRNLNEGEVELSATDGTFTVVRTARVRPGEETVVSADFSYGGAKIESVPSPCDLELTLPGHPPMRGRTPFEAAKLLEGEYAVRLTFDGVEHAGSLAVKGNGVASASFTLPIGSIKIPRTVKDAEHRAERLDGTLAKPIPAGEETALRTGDYVVRSRYRGILVESPVTIKTSLRTDCDPFAQAGTLYLATNAPGAKYALRSLGAASFTLTGSTPERIEHMPFGSYAVTFTHEGEGYSQTREFEMKDATSQQMCAFSRNIFEAVKDRDMIGFEAVTERFPQSREAIWNAIYERSRAGTFREPPYRDDASSGWVISKRYVYADSLNLIGPSKACYHVAMVSEMGDHREVQVVTVTSKLTTTTQPEIRQTYSADFNRDASRELSRKFVDDLRTKLSPKQ